MGTSMKSLFEESVLAQSFQESFISDAPIVLVM